MYALHIDFLISKIIRTDLEVVLLCHRFMDRRSTTCSKLRFSPIRSKQLAGKKEFPLHACEWPRRWGGGWLVDNDTNYVEWQVGGLFDPISRFQAALNLNCASPYLLVLALEIISLQGCHCNMNPQALERLSFVIETTCKSTTGIDLHIFSSDAGGFPHMPVGSVCTGGLFTGNCR